MYSYNAEPPIAIPIYTVLPYCVIGILQEDFFVNPFSSNSVLTVMVHYAFQKQPCCFAPGKYNEP